MNKNKVLITGGEGGIAVAIKSLLQEKGYIVYSPSKYEMDVTNIESIDNVVSKFQPDILINNAGCVEPQSIKEGNFNNTRKQIEINLIGVFYCSEIVLKYNQVASIINIGSAAAVEVHSTWSEYCATKAAVVMATKCWAEDDIYSVVFSPGRTRTKMRKALFPDEDQSTLLTPEDFAKVVIRGVEKKYPAGSHIIVRKENVNELF